MNVSCPECSTVFRVDPAKVPAGGVRARCSTCNGVITIASPSTGSTMGQLASDPIGDAFAPRRSTPAPFIPQQSSARATPQQSAAGARTPASVQRVQTPPAQTRVPTPVTAPRVPTPVTAPRVPTPVTAPRVPTPVAAPRVQTPSAPARIATPPVSTGMTTPSVASPALGASLPPRRTTPGTPWQPAAAFPSVPPAPVSVPAYTPPSAPPVAAPAAAASSTAPTPVAGDRRPINPFLARDPGLRAKRLARALVSDMVAYYPAKHSEGLEKGTLKELFRDEIKKSYDEYVAQVGSDFARTTTHFQESLNEVLGAGKKIF
jgi:predicted Zn finger-like uncharacterized protein